MKPAAAPWGFYHSTPPDVESAALQVSEQGDRPKSSGLACVCTAQRYLTALKFPDEAQLNHSWYCNANPVV